MSTFPLKPTHKPVKAYYEALAHLEKHGFVTEGNTRDAFAALLRHCAKSFDLELTPEVSFKGTGKQSLRADGILYDKTSMSLRHGFWEAKDSDDDLRREAEKKIVAGYPAINTLFQSPDRAILYQNNRIKWDDSLRSPEKLVEVLDLFFTFQQRDIADWRDAVEKFSGKLPELAADVLAILTKERQTNPEYAAAYDAFAELCRQSINPELHDDAIEKMLVQHLLTERIFRNIFDNKEFLQRNVIAVEIEKVIRLITKNHFSRDTFLQRVERFYTAIEAAARQTETYAEKQQFLNNVYEKFFQNFDRKQADTHGVVYTPQPIVDFMVRSVEEILKQEFGKSLSDSGVHILDPFTGTGNFITRIMREIKRSKLPQKYAEELHCNEIMLLPYYIASMNIEHAYMECMGDGKELGEYRSFEGICLVDTFEVKRQMSSLGEENARRIAKQNKQEIFVVVGNPPYNAWQENEDDNNKNRSYPVLDGLLKQSYVKSSTAKNKNALWDMYVRAFRWASDRVGEEGIIAFVSNNGFLDGLAFDGMRRSLAETFSEIYHFDLKGNARTSGERRRREGGNIFNDAIRVGIGITLLVKKKIENKSTAQIHLFRVADYLTRAAKEQALIGLTSCSSVPWHTISPERGEDWFASAEAGEGISISDEGGRGGLFASHSNGVKTNRDGWAYGFNADVLGLNITKTIEFYNSELERWAAHGGDDLDAFLRYDASQISWSRDLKGDLANGNRLVFNQSAIRCAAYRPFTKTNLYFDPTLNEEIYSLPKFVHGVDQNSFMTLTGPGSEKPFMVIASDCLPDFHIVGAASTGQCFPFYTYDKNGGRRENIPSIALQRFRAHYADDSITKWDIFHTVYAVLHHPEYRTRYAANLKRELPRIPFPPDFHAFAKAGKRLMELHIDYEKQKEYPLEGIENPKEQVSFRVERMKLSKDKSELRYNDFLTLRGIPAGAFDYRLGNRSALEWVIDQYRVSTDARSGIVNDPNRADDATYILRLVRQVITVSLETQAIVAALPSLGLPE